MKKLASAALACAMLCASVVLAGCGHQPTGSTASGLSSDKPRPSTSAPISRPSSSPDTPSRPPVTSAPSSDVSSGISADTSSELPESSSPVSSDLPLSSEDTSSSDASSSRPVTSTPVSSDSAYRAGTYRTTAALNMRSGAGTGYNRLLTVPAGVSLVVTRFVNGWGAVSYQGQSGYVSMDYMKYVSASTSAPSTPTGSTPDTPIQTQPLEPLPVSPELEELRSTYIYQAVRKLNTNVDFARPELRGETAYTTEWSGANGFETVNGLPDYAYMKQKGMCCAGFVNYYLFNFLPNVKGVNTGIVWKSHPENSGTDLHTSRIRANSISETMNNSSWTKIYGNDLVYGKDYSYIKNDYYDGKMIYQIGDILTMSCTDSRYYHVAVYAGYYDGQHWLAHSAFTPNNVGVTLTPFNGYCLYRGSRTVYVTEIFTP